LVVSGWAWQGGASSGPGGASVLLLYTLGSDRVERIIRTNPVACAYVAADEEDNIWCLGLTIDKREAGSDYALVYKFSRAGVLLSEFFPRSLFPHRGDFGPQAGEPFRPSDIGQPELTATNDGLVRAWLPNVNTLLEWDLEGNLTSRSELPRRTSQPGHFYQVAFLPDGEPVGFVPTSDRGPQGSAASYSLFRIDRSSSRWLPLGEETPTFTQGTVFLAGADESGVVLRDTASNKLFWVAVSKSK
ncbi:MAG: hypothetical protein ACREA0_32675, partial [bacterium]